MTAIAGTGSEVKDGLEVRRGCEMLDMPRLLKPLSSEEDLPEVRLEPDLPVPGLRLLELELLESELNELPVPLDELPVPVVLLDADGVGDLLNADGALHAGAVRERGRGTSWVGEATRQDPTTSPCHPSGAAGCLLSPELG